MRWVHITELLDPTPWLRGGELLLTHRACSSTGAKAQRELIERLAEHEIAGLGFGTGFAHKKLPAALAERRAQARLPAVRGALRAAVHRDHRARVRAAARRALRDAAAQHGRRRARRGADRAASTPRSCRRGCARSGSASRRRCWRSRSRDPGAAASTLGARSLERAGASHSLVAIRAGLLCAVIDAASRTSSDRSRSSWRGRSARSCAARFGEVRAAASRAGADAHRCGCSFHEARCALEAVRLHNGERPGGRLLPRPRRLPAAALAAGRRRAGLLLPRRARPGRRARASTATSCCARWTCSSSTTATGRRPRSALYCHRHTLRYRIKPRRAADRPRLLQRARPDRVLAGAARHGSWRDDAIGVPSEIKPDEYRVAITPAGVRELSARGHEVLVQAGAGEGSAIDRRAVRRAGRPDRARRRGGVRRGRAGAEGQGAPARRGASCCARARRCSPTCTWRPSPSWRGGCRRSGATCIAYETVEDADGRLPLLAPMSEVAGKIATQAGAFMLEKPLGGPRHPARRRARRGGRDRARDRRRRGRA